ncbi:MAG: TolC family protein [Bacteroidaceae bacterium]|nr:TolC family protein [Bacteroidaceae bacterium]
MKIRNVFSSFLLAFSLSAFAQQEVPASAGTLDIDLNKAIEIALAENPTMVVADKEIELKKVADKEAWQNLLPSLDANLSLSHSIQVAAIKTQMGEFKMGMDGSTTAMGALALQLPLFAPAIYQNMKLTKEDILLAQEKARGSRLDLIKQVTRAYYAALLAKDSYEVMQKSLKVSEENFNVVSSKFDVGKVSEYDKISADVQRRNMSSAVVSAETGVKLSLLQLKVLMGVTENVDLNITDNLRNYENRMTLAEAESGLSELDNNSSIKQIDYNAMLLRRARKIQQTNFMPTVAMQLSYQYQSYSNPNWNIFNYHYSPSSTIAFAVTVPIFKASNWTKLKSNKIQQEQLNLTRQNTVNQLSMAVESYRQNMANSIAQAESNREAVRQATKAVSIMGKRYEVGHGTILELNQSETALTQTELTYNQSIYDFLVNKADLDYTLGRERQ